MDENITFLSIEYDMTSTMASTTFFFVILKFIPRVLLIYACHLPENEA